jgi:hydroxymethylbilane synthase
MCKPGCASWTTANSTPSSWRRPASSAWACPSASAILAPQESLPAVGQGALGIEIRSKAIAPNWPPCWPPSTTPITAACVLAERAMSRRLQGGCQAPIGGYAVVRDDRLHLRAFVADLEGIRFFHATAEGPLDAPEGVGLAAAEDLIRQGADRLLAELVHRNP